MSLVEVRDPQCGSGLHISKYPFYDIIINIDLKFVYVFLEYHDKNEFPRNSFLLVASLYDGALSFPVFLISHYSIPR